MCDCKDKPGILDDQAILGRLLEVIAENAVAMQKMADEMAILKGDIEALRRGYGGFGQVIRGPLDLHTSQNPFIQPVVLTWSSNNAAPNMQELLDELSHLSDPSRKFP